MKKVLGAACILSLLISVHEMVWAGGMGLYEMGTPDTGSAAAGRAALAQDASTAFTNPAGMSKLGGSEMMIGLETLVITAKFNPGSGTTTSGSNGGNAGGVIPAGSLFLVQKVNDKFDVGVSMASYSGLGIEYSNDWVGRYYVQKSELTTVNLNPVFSYKVSDKLSLGAGFSAMFGNLDLRSAVNTLGNGDGTLSLKDQTAGFGGNAGFLFSPFKGTRVGATYRSPVNLPFKDVASASGLGPGLAALQSRIAGTTIDATVTIPQEVMLSGYQKITEKVALLANFGWQNWSQFGEVNLTVNDATQRDATVSANYKDTYHGAIGTQVQLSEKTLWSLGMAYDTSAVQEADRTPAVPFDVAYRYATGLVYKLAENATVGATYELINGGSASINQTRPLAGTLQGSYSSWLNILGFNLNVRY